MPHEMLGFVIDAIGAALGGLSSTSSQVPSYGRAADASSRSPTPRKLEGDALQQFVDALVAVAHLNDGELSADERHVALGRLFVRDDSGPPAAALAQWEPLFDRAVLRAATGDHLQIIDSAMFAMPDNATRRALALGIVCVSLAETAEPGPRVVESWKRCQGAGSFSNVVWQELIDEATLWFRARQSTGGANTPTAFRA